MARSQNTFQQTCLGYGTGLIEDRRTLPRSPASLLTKNNTQKSYRNSKNRCYSKNDL